MLALVVVLSLVSQAWSSPAAVGVSLGSVTISSLAATASKRIEAAVAATHPAPVSPTSDVTFSDFNLGIELEGFEFHPDGSAGWGYVGQDVSFKYQVKKSIISESGQIYIFTTNLNQKTLLVTANVSFASVRPLLSAVASSYNVEQGDLIIFGHCDDTICVIPVKDIIDPLAAAFFPDLAKALNTEVQKEGQTLLDKISDIVSFNASGTIVKFNLEGALTVLSSGSLLYSAAGALSSNSAAPPVANTHSIPKADSWASDNGISLALGEYFFSNMLWVLAETGDLDLTIRKGSGPIQLNTENAFFKAAMPGLANYTGLNLTLGLSAPRNWTETSINASGINLSAMSWIMTIDIVKGENIVVANAAVLNVTLGFDLNLTAAISGNNLTLQASLLSHQANVVEISSKIGAIETEAFDVLLRFAFALASIPPVAVALPSDITLQSAKLQLDQWAVVLILNATVALPPASSFEKEIPTVSALKPSLVVQESFEFERDFGVQLCGTGEASCAEGSTCCPGTNATTFGCCPSLHATCCTVPGYCCPNGSGCTADNPPQCGPF